MDNPETFDVGFSCSESTSSVCTETAIALLIHFMLSTSPNIALTPLPLIKTLVFPSSLPLERVRGG